MERIKEEEAFFSSAAHELRTPLTVIRMTAALLKDKFETLGHDKVTEYLRRMDETGEQLVKLVNDFLNISRIDQGRLVVTRESFDIIALTDEAINDLKLLAKERHLSIDHDPACDSRTVWGDRTKAKEVLTNLLSNALKYTIQGGITVTHGVQNGMLATKVTDTGAGIPEEYQPLLFKRFQQIGEAHRQASSKSSGLGLYISKKFALLMHGNLILEKSEPNKGSTFTFTLPIQ